MCRMIIMIIVIAIWKMKLIRLLCKATQFDNCAWYLIVVIIIDDEVDGGRDEEED